MCDLAKEFEADLLGRLDKAQALTGYGFSGIRDLIASKGAVGTALHLLDLSNLGARRKGLRVMEAADLLECSLEQAVLDWADSDLFPKTIIISARAQLILARKRQAHQASLSTRSDS